jgi:hypothetical protein
MLTWVTTANLLLALTALTVSTLTQHSALQPDAFLVMVMVYMYTAISASNLTEVGGGGRTAV